MELRTKYQGFKPQPFDTLNTAQYDHISVTQSQINNAPYDRNVQYEKLADQFAMSSTRGQHSMLVNIRSVFRLQGSDNESRIFYIKYQVQAYRPEAMENDSLQRQKSCCNLQFPKCHGLPLNQNQMQTYRNERTSQAHYSLHCTPTVWVDCVHWRNYRLMLNKKLTRKIIPVLTTPTGDQNSKVYKNLSYR